jgi:hypothetical protein
MPENAPHFDGHGRQPPTERVDEDPFGLRAYVEREIAARRASGAPTTADWLAGLEAIKDSDPDWPQYTPDELATVIREAREERDARADAWCG